MAKSVQPKGVLFVSTYPPQKCGIASFTQDLMESIGLEISENVSLNVCALNKKEMSGEFGFPVTMMMDGDQLGSCIESAEIINQNPAVDLVCIEHEFGLYGGEYGEYLLSFLELLEKPFVIRFHTVLPSPELKRLKVVQKLAALAEKIIVMTKNSARLLTEDYHVDAEKIITIPHGTHPNSAERAEKLKRRYDLEGRMVLTTFGLLSPNKGIEKGIKAMKEISKKVPDAIYVVVGLTHPNLLKQEGERYRNSLQQIIEDNNLQDNVRLVNEYVPTQKLMEYLALTDIYLFTSKDPNQAVSGTFLYAMSAGCPIISNSFVLASEMLNEKTGIILSTNKESELADEAIRLLQNNTLRQQMRHNALLATRNTTWQKVAGRHVELFDAILDEPALDSELSTQLMSQPLK